MIGTIVFAVIIGLFFFCCFHKKKYFLYYLAYKINALSNHFILLNRPKRIILLRHGETTANVDSKVYSTTPDNKIELTEKGRQQAETLGQSLKKLIKNESILFYISTFTRCSQTFENIKKSFLANTMKILYDPRIREQEWGNYQRFSESYEELQNILKEREKVGKMYYRFDHGESGCDVYVRVASFMESMFRWMDHYHKEKYQNVIIVTHGLTMRYFIMKYLKLSVEQFEKMWNPKNCEFWVLENDGKGNFHMKSEIRGLGNGKELEAMSPYFK